MKILAPLLYASVQRPSAWSFMVIRVKIERKDIIRCALVVVFFHFLGGFRCRKFVN